MHENECFNLVSGLQNNFKKEKKKERKQTELHKVDYDLKKKKTI